MQAQRCLSARDRVPWPQPGRGVFYVSRRNHTSFSHEDPLHRPQLEKFLFLIPYPGESLAELVSGVKLLDWGGEWECGGSRDKDLCQRVAQVLGCTSVWNPSLFLSALQAPHARSSPLSFLDFSCLKARLLDFL